MLRRRISSSVKLILSGAKGDAVTRHEFTVSQHGTNCWPQEEGLLDMSLYSLDNLEYTSENTGAEDLEAKWPPSWG